MWTGLDALKWWKESLEAQELWLGILNMDATEVRKRALSGRVGKVRMFLAPAGHKFKSEAESPDFGDDQLEVDDEQLEFDLRPQCEYVSHCSIFPHS